MLTGSTVNAGHPNHHVKLLAFNKNIDFIHIYMMIQRPCVVRLKSSGLLKMEDDGDQVMDELDIAENLVTSLHSKPKAYFQDYLP